MKIMTNPINIITMETPFPVGPVNVYLIKDDPIILIDVGPNLNNSEDYLEAFLDSLGVQFTDIKRIIITHLDILVEEGRVSEQEIEGVTFFSL